MNAAKLSASQVSALRSIANPTGAARGVNGARWTGRTLAALETAGLITREGAGYVLTGMGRLELDLASSDWEAK